jgi:alpha-L-fucosidase
MSELLCKSDYEAAIAATRDERMAWFRKARFGMFIHYGIYALYGRNEWVMALENIPVAEYEARADEFQPRKGSPREWAKLASEAGMKYVVLTAKHHEGFCLWGTKMTDFNSVTRGPKRDIVAEFVEACREFGLKVGLYYSLMDWHHPDGARCAFDSAARRRFLDYTQGCLRELMSSYGTIDLLWYDGAAPMQHHEGWESLEMNQMVRELQPNIIINNRSHLDEDLGTPEGELKAEDRDWEACMTFNGTSWGYVDSKQAAPDSYNVRGILSMLRKVCSQRGNLLLNIGPAPDGSVPAEAVEPLQQTGAWIRKHADVIYPISDRFGGGVSGWAEATRRGRTVWVWTKIWPHEPAGLGGFMSRLRSACLLPERTPLKFEQSGGRILFTDLPDTCPDEIANRAIIELEFEEDVHRCVFGSTPALRGGQVLSPQS